MPLKKFIKDYFSFSRKERIGLLSLLVLILVIYLLPVLFEKERKFPLEKISVLTAAVDSEEKKKVDIGTKVKHTVFSSDGSTPIENFTDGDLFSFDPNHLSVDGWRHLGLGEKTIKIIDRYRSKGGRFYKPEDLKKIWGMPQRFYERVKGYVVIEKEKQYDRKGGKNEIKQFARNIAIININEADTSAWIDLPGIGSKLATRIVNFRDRLGGFYSVDQVSETFGLPDSTFQKIKPYLIDRGEVKKININTATKDELKSHPYLKWNLANAIVEYRNQHGSFKSLDELKQIAMIDEATFRKIVMYLEL
ncbi:MAG: helix-hairpin-helix domain-containing protein [Flavisolibacter sp.]